MKEKNEYPFSTFVDINNPKVLEMIAYSIYKIRKIKYEIDLDEEDLSDEEYQKKLEDFKALEIREDNVKLINDTATDVLFEFTNQYVKKLKLKQFWSNVLSSIVASLIVASISVGFTIYISLKKIVPSISIHNVITESVEKSISTIDVDKDNIKELTVMP